jgi:hypothetical protein
MSNEMWMLLYLYHHSIGERVGGAAPGLFALDTAEAPFPFVVPFLSACCVVRGIMESFVGIGFFAVNTEEADTVPPPAFTSFPYLCSCCFVPGSMISTTGTIA